MEHYKLLVKCLLDRLRQVVRTDDGARESTRRDAAVGRGSSGAVDRGGTHACVELYASLCDPRRA